MYIYTQSHNRHTLWQELVHLWMLTLRLRFLNTNDDDDYLTWSQKITCSLCQK